MYCTLYVYLYCVLHSVCWLYLYCVLYPVCWPLLYWIFNQENPPNGLVHCAWRYEKTPNDDRRIHFVHCMLAVSLVCTVRCIFTRFVLYPESRTFTLHLHYSVQCTLYNIIAKGSSSVSSDLLCNYNCTLYHVPCILHPVISCIMFPVLVEYNYFLITAFIVSLAYCTELYS